MTHQRIRLDASPASSPAPVAALSVPAWSARGGRWLLCGAMALGALTGCGEDKPEPPPADKNYFAEKPKIDFSQVKVDKPAEPVAPTPVADTWASRTRELVATAHADLQKCRNEFMIPFQFDKMRTRDVTWLSISEMDAVCRDGDRATKRRGPWSILQFLAKEHTGKHPALDKFIALGHDHVEHFRIVSLMTKKVGSPKIAAVTDTAEAARARVIEAGRELDAAAREIAGFADDLLPDDSAESASKDLDAAAYAALLSGHYGFLIGDALGAYDRLASKSWQSPNMVKKTTLKLWAEIPTKLLQQDRPRVGKVAGLSDADKARFEAYLASVDGVLAAWRKSYERYLENKEGDTWSEKDPYRPALLKAHKAWTKLHAGLQPADK
ncbi:MAG: hypothetical protein RIT45_3318 [Pseudomonadota bacterium]